MSISNADISNTESNDKKKILLIGHTDGLGGAQTAYKQLYYFIKREGYLVCIINITDHEVKDQPFGTDDLIGVIRRTTSGLTSQINKWTSLVLVGLLARRFNPDIFISVGLSNSSNFISRFLNNKCFKIAQDFIANRAKGDVIWDTTRANLNGVAVQAPSMLNYWISIGENQLGINWLPCFPEPPVPNILKSIGADLKQEIKLAYFGRLAGNKGLPLLFKAIADQKISDKITLDLWGKGEEETNLKNLSVELGISSRVKFLGKYPDKEEGAKLMIVYDALVLTSTTMEGLPLILLEAMAYGLPFLATDIGAIRDCCIDNPDTVLVQPTLDGISSGLGILIEKIEAGEFNSDRLRLFYQERFSHAVMEARWRDCLNKPKSFFYEYV